MPCQRGGTKILSINFLNIECNENFNRKGERKNLFLPKLLRKLPNAGTVFKRFEIKDLNNQGVDFKELYDKHNRHLIFFSFSRFFETKKEYAVFKPLQRVNTMILKETEIFDAHTIGIHIRRTDHRIAIKNSPIELFEQKIEEELAKTKMQIFIWLQIVLKQSNN